MPKEHKIPSSAATPEKLALIAGLKHELKALASSKGAGASAVCVIDPSDRLMRVLAVLEAPSHFVDPALANNLHAAVLRCITKPTVGRRATIILKHSGVDSIRRLLTSTMRALASSLRAQGRKSGIQLDNFAKRSMNTMYQCCGIAESPAAWKSVLQFARDACSISSTPFDSFLSEQHLGQTYRQIESRIVEAVSWAMRNGDTANLVDLSNLIRRHADIRERTNDHIARILAERASSLPDASQEWAMRQLGLDTSESRVEYSDPSNAPEVRQAASLLLLLFDEQRRNPEFKEAFERFRGLCEAHFHLFLRGDIGGVTEFDRRLHEDADVAAVQVRLVRPWIEWYVPPKARVVIRGIVEGCKGEREAI